jgi:osmotically-inducible protein OsmY
MLSGCIPIILGGAAAGGGYVAGQERGVVTTAKDTGIKATIKDKFFRYSSDMSDQIDTTVWEGEVLLTGAVSNPEWRDEASRLAWQAEGVKAVHNEIEVRAANSLWDDTKDSWITTRLRSGITLDSKIRSLNYTVETVNGVVYLMGAARTQGEADLVTDYARNIPNVRRVVSFVHVRPGEPSRDIAPTAGTPAPAPADNGPSGNAPAGNAPAYNAPASNAPAYNAPGYTPPSYNPPAYGSPGQGGAPAPLAPPAGGKPRVEMTPLS